MADDTTFHDDIEGYAGRLGYRVGETVTLQAATRRRLGRMPLAGHHRDPAR